MPSPTLMSESAYANYCRRVSETSWWKQKQLTIGPKPEAKSAAMKKKEILLAISNFLYHEAMMKTAPGYTNEGPCQKSDIFPKYMLCHQEHSHPASKIPSSTRRMTREIQLLTKPMARTIDPHTSVRIVIQVLAPSRRIIMFEGISQIA